MSGGHEIRLIRLGVVNAYLIATSGGFVLVDTGHPTGRRKLLRGVEAAGCVPGRLPLVVMTHADTDHTGNAAYLR
mgnify:CR=1 FL=1